MCGNRLALGIVGGLLFLVGGAWQASGSGFGDVGRGAQAGDPLLGQPAPRFVLPAVEGSYQVDSDTLFDLSAVTMLMFWTTHCAECVRRLETCQELLDWGEADGFNVIGINFDDQPTAKTRLLARQATPRVTHLYDTGGRVSQAYGAGAHSFSIYLVDGAGIVRDIGYEILVDGLVALRPELMALIEEAFSDEEWPEQEGGRGDGAQEAPRPGILEEFGLLRQQKLSVHGRGRVRWMHIDTTGVGATGAYGEELRPGALLHHRLELEIAYAITPRLMAGGLIWLSNEGEAVLRSGPEYLSTPWGSAFIRYDAQGDLFGLGHCESSLRAGYYDAVFTPLTLMRWDENDTPISGGQRASGCGVCGGEAGMAGFIRLESLETLAPELTLEGARLDMSLMDRVDLTALYARPQTAWPSGRDKSLCCTAELDALDTYYHQELYAGRATAHISLPWCSELLEISGTAVAIEDDAESAPCVISCMSADPFSDRVIACDFLLPLPHRTELYGEAAASWWKPDKQDESADPLDGTALQAGVTFDIRPSAGTALLGIPLDAMMTRIDASYQRFSQNFYSAYSALSYEANLHGPRVFMRMDWGPVGVGGFFKYLTPAVTTEDDSAAEPKKMTASVWLDGIVWPGGTLMVGGVLEDRNLPTSEVGKEKQKIFIASFVQELAPRCSLVLETQLLDGSRDNKTTDTVEEYTSTTIRAMLDVEF